MPHENLIKDLEALGLSEKEAQVYMASLSIGESSVQNIAKKSSVNRVTTYVMIEQLTQKGLMSSFVKGKKKMYAAERPERLLSLLNEKMKEVRTQESHFRSVLPMLNAVMSKADNKTNVRLYEGIEGIKAAHQVLAAAFKQSGFDTYYEVIIPSQSNGLFKEGDSPARDEVRKTVLENKITAKKIYVMDYERERHIFEESGAFEQITAKNCRVLDLNKMKLTNEVGIYGHYTVFWVLKDEYTAVLIDDDAIAKNMRQFFYALWSMADPANDKHHIDLDPTKL